MDRSFLSNAQVIEAAKDFVCVRLLSYENQKEMDLLKTFGAGKSGEVENTVVCVFAPDGKTQLTRAGRSTDHLFSDPAQMARRMQKIAEGYPRKLKGEVNVEAPWIATVKLALNVAACDSQPLVVALVKDDAEGATLEATLADFAWNREFEGKFVFARTRSSKDLSLIRGVTDDARLFVVQPDSFGIHGNVLGQTKSSAREHIAETLRASLRQGKPRTFDFSSHVRSGKQQGIFWNTATPVTDPMEAKARERGRKGS